MWVNFSLRTKYLIGVFGMCFGFVHFFSALLVHHGLLGTSEQHVIIWATLAHIGVFMLGVLGYRAVRSELCCESYAYNPVAMFAYAREELRKVVYVVWVFSFVALILEPVKSGIPWVCVAVLITYVWSRNTTNCLKYPLEPHKWFKLTPGDQN